MRVSFEVTLKSSWPNTLKSFPALEQHIAFERAVGERNRFTQQEIAKTVPVKFPVNNTFPFSRELVANILLNASGPPRRS